MAASLLLVPVTIFVGHRLGLVSKPRLFGKSERVIPNVGGIGLALAAALAFHSQYFFPSAMGAIAVGAALAAILGMADDRIPFIGHSPLRRLLLQIGIALAAWSVGFSADAPGLIGLLATVLFLVAAMNAFNLLDNMDGVAGVTGAATAGGLAVLAAMGGQSLVAGLAAAVSGACLGFVLFNIHNARVYLGNGGSLVLGFLIGGAALKLRLPVDYPWSTVGAVAALAVPFSDSAVVMISRTLARRPVMLGGTDHISHRLVELGAPTQASALLHGLGALIATGLVVLALLTSAWLTVLPIALFGILGILLVRVPVYVKAGEAALTGVDLGADWASGRGTEPGMHGQQTVPRPQEAIAARTR